MRIKSLQAGALAVVPAFLIAVSPTEAHAQSLLQAIFGAPAAKPVSRPPVRLQRQSRRLPARSSPRATFPGHVSTHRQPWNQSRYRSGSYKTICVRTCDGYYFPISPATSRNSFHSQARECKRRCGSEATLFYMSRHASDIATARDLSGRSYEDLEHAYKYRDSLVDGCTCRPMPWSAQERARHNQYQYVATIHKSYAVAEKRKQVLQLERALESKVIAAKRRTIVLAQAADAPGDIKRFGLGKDARNDVIHQPQVVELYAGVDPFALWQDHAIRYAAPAPTQPVRYQQVASYEFGQNDQTPTNGFYAEYGPSLPAARMAAFSDEVRADMAVRSRSTKRRPTRPRKTSGKKKKKKSGTAFSGLFGTQPSKYRWPGD